MKIRHFFYAAALATMAGCSSENEGVADAERTPINLSYSTVEAVETRTAATLDLNDANIAAGREITVTVTPNTGAEGGSTGDFTYTAGASGAMTAPATPPYYPTSGSVKLTAYHPSDAAASFSVQTDQTSDDAYNASDLMWSDNQTAVTKTSDAVNLAFNHKMSKLIVNVTAGAGVNYIQTVTVKGVKPTVTFNKTTGAVGDADGTATDITLFKDGASGTTTASGAVVFPSQSLTSLLDIVTDQGTATYALSEAKTFTAGNKYTINLTVNKTAVGITNTVSWNSGEGTLQVNATVEKTNAPEGAVAVDLGLSVKWANMNVGSTSVTEYGDHFAWGETSGTVKGSYNWYTYAWTSGDYSNSNKNVFTKYVPSAGSDYWDTTNAGSSPDNKTTLDLADDAARANWGGSWRMPTYTELNELYATKSSGTLTWTWYNAGGAYTVAGWEVKKDDTHKIFLPAAGGRYDASPYDQGSNGDYWSSSVDEEDPNLAWRLYYFNSEYALMNSGSRYYGRSVRPVQNK